jgi:hypothetical protein
MRALASAVSLSAQRQQSTPSASDVIRPEKESKTLRSSFIALTAGAAAMACLLSLLPATGHDQMWCLYVAQRILAGVRLYGPHLLESNPPLIMGMLLLPAEAARILHLPVTLLFKLCVLATEALVALASLRLLRKLRAPVTPARLWAYAFAFVCVFAVLPARDFGQRDQLLAVLLLPYVIAAALAAESAHGRVPLSRWARVAIGFAAGIGVSLKPHHLLIPAAIEAFLLFGLMRTKREPIKLFPSAVRIEAVVILLTCAAYLAAIRLFTPEYLTQILPILRDTYWAIGPLTLPQLVAQAIELHILAAVALLLYFLSGRRKASPLTTLLLVVGAAGTVAYYLQGTGWYYQQIPALSFFSLALFLELLDLASRQPVRLPAWIPAAAAAHPLEFPSGLSDVPDPSFFAGLAPGTPIAILTTEVDDSVPPFFTRHLLWAQRENNLWTLPAILRNESPTAPTDPRRRIPPPRLAELDRMQHAWMVQDLAYWHPALILVNRCQDPAVRCQILEDRHDNLLAWFERDPAFQQEFARYHFLRSSGPFDAYVPD